MPLIVPLLIRETLIVLTFACIVPSSKPLALFKSALEKTINSPGFIPII